MTKKSSLRITLDVIMLIAVLLGWWFVAIPLGVVGAWMFPRYLELVVAGFVYDMLYALNDSGHMGILGYAYLISSVIILLIMSYFKIIFKSHA